MSQINKPNTYFNSVLYSGNGGTQSITGVNFQPDLVYIKGRNTTLKYPTMFDSVRGATKRLTTHTTNAEDTHVTMLTSFDSDGWSSGSDDQTNASGTNYVCWNWKAGGTAVSNTDGATTTSVSANTTSDFSIVSWTGTAGNTTIGHGLGTVPSCIIAKDRSNGGSNWVVWHKDLTSGYFLKLNLTNTQDNANAYFTSNPTSSLISLSGGGAFNGSGDAMIAYCFAEKKGFSKFGKYTGNASTNAPFVYTGFKPAYIVIKSSTYAGNWLCYDNKRDPYNENSGNPLNINESGGEGADPNYQIDFLSNGFKLRNNNGNINNNGETMVYMCFAENPLVGTNNIPATAR